MPEYTGEISQAFAPLLPVKKKEVMQPVVTKTPEPVKQDPVESPQQERRGGIFATILDRGKQVQETRQQLFPVVEAKQPEPVVGFRKIETPKKDREPIPGTVEERANMLYQALLDKVELQLDVHRRARAIVAKTEFSSEQIQQEIARVRLEPKFASFSPEQLQREALKQLRAAKARELVVDVQQSSNLDMYTQLEQSNGDKSISIETIVSGQLSMTEVMNQLTLIPPPNGKTQEHQQKDSILIESKRQLAEVNDRIDHLMDDEQVIKHYNEMRSERVKLLRQAREASFGKKALREISLTQERLVQRASIEQRVLTGAEEHIIRRNQKIAEAIRQRVDNLASNPEVFNQLRFRELREYQKGLKKDRFAETPSRAELVDKVRRGWAEGRRLLATGETGTGKTELFFHASRTMYGEEPEKTTGHAGLTSYEIYGRPLGNGFEPGPRVKAIDRNVPYILDEINAVENSRVLMRLKTDYNARLGQIIKVQEEGNGHEHVIGDQFSDNATANVKSEKHPDRVDLDPALVRMFDTITVDYLPKHELFDILVASLMDVRGGLQLSSNDDIQALQHLCQAAEQVQQAYKGQEVSLDGQKMWARGGQSTGKLATLREAVLDPGKAMDMLKGWENSRMEGKTLREHLSERIAGFINNENYPADDRYYLAEIFAHNKFLQGMPVAELGVPGLTEDVLKQWNGFDGKKVQARDVYLPVGVVSQLDPFNILNRPDGAAVEDLLGPDETADFSEDSQAPTGPGWQRGGKGREVQRGRWSQNAQRELDTIDIQYTPQNLKNGDNEMRYKLYPERLNEMLGRHPDTIEEVMSRYLSLLDVVEPNAIDIMWFLERLKNGMEDYKKSHVLPKSLLEILKSINERTFWKEYQRNSWGNWINIDKTLIGDLFELYSH